MALVGTDARGRARTVAGGAVTPPRFERMGDLWAIHYPRGYTIAETPLAALQQALRIQRWRLANERVIASWEVLP